MHLITRNPWELMNGLNRDIDRWFLARTTAAPASWAPAVDVAETDDHYVFAADLPGVNREDVDITLEDRVLTIQGSRKLEEDTHKDGLRRIERIHGRFHRRFRLPELASEDGVEATYAEGVLTVRVPKQPRPEARRIEVKAN